MSKHQLLQLKICLHTEPDLWPLLLSSPQQTCKAHLCHTCVRLPVCFDVCSCSGHGQRSLSPVTTPRRRVQRRREPRPALAVYRITLL